MLALPTALLLHTTRAGRHHDWLLGDPTTAARNPLAPLWTDDRRVLDLTLRHFTGRLELRRLDATRWRAHVLCG